MCWLILIRVCGFEDMPASASMWRVWRGCWCVNVPSVLRIWNVVAVGAVLIKSDFFFADQVCIKSVGCVWEV